MCQQYSHKKGQPAPQSLWERTIRPLRGTRWRWRSTHTSPKLCYEFNDHSFIIYKNVSSLSWSPWRVFSAQKDDYWCDLWSPVYFWPQSRKYLRDDSPRTCYFWTDYRSRSPSTPLNGFESLLRKISTFYPVELDLLRWRATLALLVLGLKVGTLQDACSVGGQVWSTSVARHATHWTVTSHTLLIRRHLTALRGPFLEDLYWRRGSMSGLLVWR